MTHRRLLPLLPLSPLRRASVIWAAALARWGRPVPPMRFSDWATPAVVARLGRVPRSRAVGALAGTFEVEFARQCREAQPRALARTRSLPLPVFQLVRSSMQEPRVYRDAGGVPLTCGDLVRVVNSGARFVVLLPLLERTA